MRSLPFDPDGGTSTAGELFAGSIRRARVVRRDLDFRSFRWFVATGRGTPMDAAEAVARAVHDAHLTFDLGAIIAGRRVVGVMGGHQLPRDSVDYALRGRARARPGAARDAGLLGRRARRHGGGAPRRGAVAGSRTRRCRRRSRGSRTCRACPICTASCTPTARRTRRSSPAGEWFAPAWVGEPRDPDPVETLSIPTWHYGHEPTRAVRDAHREALPELDPRGRPDHDRAAGAGVHAGERGNAAGGVPGRAAELLSRSIRTSSARWVPRPRLLDAGAAGRAAARCAVRDGGAARCGGGRAAAAGDATTSRRRPSTSTRFAAYAVA